MRRSSSRVLDCASYGFTDDPLIPRTVFVLPSYIKVSTSPNFVPPDLPPDMNLQLVVFLEGQILDNGDEDWNQRSHSLSASLRQVGDLGLLVQRRLLVLGKTVEDGVRFHVETDLRVLDVVVARVRLAGLIKPEQFLGGSHLVTILKTLFRSR